jgi:predicted nucleic-acid-binding Zn-ribbon protein
MARPTCPKCDNTRFELKELDVVGAQFKLYAIICTSCGCIVSTEEYFNTAATLNIMAKKLGITL